MDFDYDDLPDDPLAPARGLFFALLLSVPVWAPVIWFLL